MSLSASWRTHACGELRAEHAGERVTLCGWVSNRRDHGGVSFVDLRDRYGDIQLTADETASEEIRQSLTRLHPEYVLQIEGVVRLRDAEYRTKGRDSGDIEIVPERVTVVTKASRLPFEIVDDLDVPEEMRMKYRYLDMRRAPVAKRLMLRSKANHALRCTLIAEQFVEIETPMLTKSTPEGARDYLVPNRRQPNSWYALPQSPQLFKQLSMVGGMDRYFQIARCMRDEDLRADRQPEFTQLDLEMSFVDEEDVYALVERVMANLYQEMQSEALQTPFERIPYAESVARFASDKPDLRNPLEVVDLAGPATTIGFSIFESVLEKGGWVRGVRVPAGASLSRKQIDSIEAAAKDAGAGGAAWCKVGPDGPTGPLSRFLKSDEGSAFLASAAAVEGDLLVTIADRPRRAMVALDAVRRRAADLMDLVKGPDRLVWVTEFPLFEETDDGEWTPAHHPFTYPVEEDIAALKAGGREGIRSRAYDLVLNGVELGSGSIRIHNAELQRDIFTAIGLDAAEAERRFAFLLEAFRYGPPPHAGFAIGLDRLYALMFDAETIRDVIAFPKTSVGGCPLTGAPSDVDLSQVEELGLLLAPSSDLEDADSHIN
ncbi:MAG: aspartate--tRNA ligase [Planctomycetes bacterium]|jgi:aspartyl-tRNA synthetase|nr:aspartate--tRNA ligase [Planctomycetota bacterium]MBT4559419.1 aspartate--tRNA ligase [Planctomycetota bacterium]